MEKEFNPKDRTRPSARSEYTKLIVILALLFGIVLTLVLYFAWPLLTGTKIILQPHPVDPFDVFRGQYMTINYDISSVPTVKGATAGGSVYILLEQNEQDGVWRYKDASIEKPKSGTFIRGDIKSVYGSTMRVEYGIETYFFERNASIPWENITIEVMVSSNGGARILQLLQNGEPMEITYVDFPVYT